MKTTAKILSMFVCFPIWYWLCYRVLVAVNASELMWFLFWVYVPLSVFIRAVIVIAEKRK